ncbi:MAG: asparagine--tRNA ligase [Bacteriovoracaceae bacterium]|nr:asparagine--tRNA ligase [Bacteriovoracaceae bacterium]
MSELKRVALKEIFKGGLIDCDATVKGWVRSVRKSKKFSFITISDGSCQDNLQIIADETISNYEEVSTMLTGTCVAIRGKLVSSGGRQAVEMQGMEVEVLGSSDSTYPIQKKGATLEFLRDIAHLRPRTNLFGAVFRIRHALSMAVHEFFNDRGYFYLHSPIITAQDGEGAGEMFKVSTFNPNDIPRDDKGEIDYTKDYFGKQTGLTVTGQLEGECYAMGLGSVYTFGPTFRAENSNTTRHLSEFWMIEPEIAFADLEEVADVARDFVKYLIGYALDNCKDELEFLTKWNKDNSGLIDTLEHVRSSDFIKITYTEAIEILNASGQKFEFPTEWGAELQTEHEKYLTDVHYKLPVIVTDYPSTCKAFYMKQNEDGKTVRAMDVLVPGVGEIIGGSQREESYDKICARMDDLGMEKEDYWWYLDLRKYGSAPHGGFGLGFERMLMYVTGMSNVRDVIPFPRTPNNAEF